MDGIGVRESLFPIFGMCAALVDPKDVVYLPISDNVPRTVGSPEIRQIPGLLTTTLRPIEARYNGIRLADDCTLRLSVINYPGQASG
jgi:hypothetical protein